MDSTQELEASTGTGLTSSDAKTTEPYDYEDSDDEGSQPVTDVDDEGVSKEGSVKDENEKKLEKTNLVKIISTISTMIVLLFGGAGIVYAIEGKNEEDLTGHISDWKYLNCLYFCTVTLTTIGYGDLTPKTPGGKVFTVIYALISLGVMAAAITTIGQIIVVRANQQKNDFIKVSKMFTRKLKKITKLGDSRDLKRHVETSLAEIKLTEKKVKWYKWYLRLFGMLLLIGTVIFVGALAFHEFEGWAYGDAAYYCFITLLTIGYGDYYPHTDEGKIFFIFYAFIGLGLIAFVIGDVGEKILSNTHRQLQEVKLRKALVANFNQIAKLNPVQLTKKIPGPLGMKKRKDKEKKQMEKEAKEKAEREAKEKEAKEKDAELQGAELVDVSVSRVDSTDPMMGADSIEP